MKVCKKCKLSKAYEDYYDMKLNKDGKSGKCKECTKSDVKKNSQAVGSAYDFSEKGVVRVLYKTMKRHQKLRVHTEDVLPFSKEEFNLWLNANDFKAIYDFWVKSGYKKNCKPSVDRLNDFEGYSFDNMRLVTWKDNHNHQKEDILTGKGTSGKRCHGIGKYSKDGELLNTYTSYQDVRRKEGYCVHYPIKNSYPCKNGFIWKLT